MIVGEIFITKMLISDIFTKNISIFAVPLDMMFHYTAYET